MFSTYINLEEMNNYKDFFTITYRKNEVIAFVKIGVKILNKMADNSKDIIASANGLTCVSDDYCRQKQNFIRAIRKLNNYSDYKIDGVLENVKDVPGIEYYTAHIELMENVIDQLPDGSNLFNQDLTLKT